VGAGVSNISELIWMVDLLASEVPEEFRRRSSERVALLRLGFEGNEAPMAIVVWLSPEANGADRRVFKVDDVGLRDGSSLAVEKLARRLATSIRCSGKVSYLTRRCCSVTWFV
jgi:hypothetical protein